MAVLRRVKDTILIVEDSADEAQLLEEMLKQLSVGITIRHVASATAAIEYIQGDFPYSDRVHFPFPKTILLDLQLPIMNGMEFLKWLSAHDKLKEVAVIVVSGLNDITTINLAYALGAKSFLPKPYTLSDLQNLVQAFPSFLCRAVSPASSRDQRSNGH